jgi:multidrug resistance efflux pump
VVEVFVEAGSRVNAGDPLFRVDDRSLRSELVIREARAEAARRQVAIAKAELAQQKQLPRKEDVPPARARVEVAKAQLLDAEKILNLMQEVQDKRAIVQEELTRRENAVVTARARVLEAQSSLDQLLAGAWSAQLEISGAQVAQAESLVKQAEADVEATKTEIERLIVRSPVSGEVLQKNTRAGEYVQSGLLATPAMFVGNTDLLHVRVDVDENDAWRIKPGAKARVSLRGNPQIRTDDTTFVRVEPFVIPKRSLTGDSTERVDTRVLQVVYSFPRSAMPAFVGQQVDVRIEAEPIGVSTPASVGSPTPAAASN